MRLFHGTSVKRLDNILKEGIKPRGREESRWTEHPSALDRVYLSKGYAMFFGGVAADMDECEGVVLEVDATLLPLIADEDALAQATFKDMPELADLDLKQKTKFWRDNAVKYRHLAKESLRLLGNCAHIGTIKPTFIDRYVTFNPIDVLMVSDPAITLMNHHLLGDRCINLVTNYVDNNGGTVEQMIEWYNMGDDWWNQTTAAK